MSNRNKKHCDLILPSVIGIVGGGFAGSFIGWSASIVLAGLSYPLTRSHRGMCIDDQMVAGFISGVIGASVGAWRFHRSKISARTLPNPPNFAEAFLRTPTEPEWI